MYRDGLYRLLSAALAIVGSLGLSWAASGDMQSYLELCQRAKEPLSIISNCSVVIARSRDRVALERAYNRRGLALMGQSRYADAAADFTEVIRFNPRIAGYYDNRQNAYKGTKNYDAALSDANTAVRLAPTYSFVYNGRANIYVELQRYGLAIADFTTALTLAPNDAGLYVGRGNAQVKMGQIEAGVADYTKAFDIDSSNLYALRQRGLAYKLMGRLAEATADLERFRAATPDDPEVVEAIAAMSTAKAQPTEPDVRQNAENSRHVEDSRVRIALVIGNSGYANAPLLANAAADANTIGNALSHVGFNVTVRNDLTREQLMSALSQFSAAAETADWALLYYAGHGIEIDGSNYLVPIDAKLATDRSVPFEAVPLATAIGSVEGAHRLRLVIVDACRANPFANRMRLSTAYRNISRGLSRPSEYDPDTLIVYAAKDGEVASDGADHGNSPFASALASRIGNPGLEIRRLFEFVRDDVIEATGNQQHPFTYGSLSARHDFFFREK